MTKWDKPVLQVKLYVTSMRIIFIKYILSGDNSRYLVKIVVLWKGFPEFSSLKKLHLWFNKLMELLFKGAGEIEYYEKEIKLNILSVFIDFTPRGRTAERENFCI